MKMLLLLDAEQQRLLARRREFLALAEVGREGHDLAAIGGLQPFQDDRGVEPARIGEHDLLDVAFRHDGVRRVKIRADYRGNAGGATPLRTQKSARAGRAGALEIRPAGRMASRRPERAGAPRRRDSRPRPARRGSSSSAAAAGRRRPAPARNSAAAPPRRREWRRPQGRRSRRPPPRRRCRAWAGAGRIAAPMAAAVTRTIKPLVMIAIPRVAAADLRRPHVRRSKHDDDYQGMNKAVFGRPVHARSTPADAAMHLNGG